MPIYSPEELRALEPGQRAPRKSKKRGGGRARVAFLWEKVDGDPTQYNLSDPDDKAEYEVARAAGAMTASEVKRERLTNANDPEASGTGSVWKDAIADALRDSGSVGSSGSGRSRRGRKGRGGGGSRGGSVSRAAGKAGRVLRLPTTGAQLGKVAGTLATRLTIAAALVAAAWWRSKKVDDEARKDYVSREIGKREQIIGRSLSPEELAGMIDFYSAAYNAQKAYKSARSPAPKTLR